MAPVEGRASFPLPRLQSVLGLATSSLDLLKKYLHHDRHYSFILALPREVQDELLHDLARASERRASYLVRRAKSKSLELERRNLKNSRAHAKGWDARVERPGRGKRGAELCLFTQEHIGSDVDQCLTPLQDSDHERSASLPAGTKTRSSVNVQRRTRVDVSQDIRRGDRRTKMGRSALQRKKKMFENRKMLRRAAGAHFVRSRARWHAVSSPSPVQRARIRILPAVNGDTFEPDGVETMHHSVALDCAGVAIPSSHRSDVLKLTVILFDGTDLLTDIEFALDDRLAALQSRIVDVLGTWHDIVSSSGIFLTQNGHLTAGEAGLQDGDILTAIMPTNPSVRYNLLTIEERIEEDIARIRELIEDESRFQRVAERQFRILYEQNRRGATSPCTALASRICLRVCAPAISSSRIVDLMIAESSTLSPSLCETEFVRFFRAMLCSIVKQLEWDRQGAIGAVTTAQRLSDEAWLRSKLQECAPGPVVLNWDTNGYTSFLPGLRRRPRNRGRVRLSPSDASCQVFHTNVFSAGQVHRLIVADGHFRIQGHEVMFEWKDVATCELVAVSQQLEYDAGERTEWYDFARKGQWQRGRVDDPTYKRILREVVDIRPLMVAAETPVPAWERQEVGIGLSVLESPHCNVEF
eukprot:TRINITY_DN71837_c0_g1_i1.p1 TRINITY_DN71837_c0_g1~~TRINITY_DN71837_c0_g1_i1.p1  ORF type:complete len:640 (-),score=68.47 TRINITY_DN71837_c0_g1_i1:98-2017(-)